MSGPSEETFEVGGQTFHVDQVWQVDGLVAAATYNGKLGATKQAAGARHPGRVQVQLLSQPTVVLAIKPKTPSGARRMIRCTIWMTASMSPSKTARTG